MGLFGSLEISASALTAERVRMDVTAENLANAQTTNGPNGEAYRRKAVLLGQVQEGGGFETALRGAMGSRGGQVEVVAIAEDAGPPRRVYDPSHPSADEQGYVEMPNVNPVTEMVDLITASRAYEANVTAMQTAKHMFAKTLELLR
jgi:flagellar basal-body rod protein FlgC